MTQRTKNNTRAFVIGMVLGGYALAWMVLATGCGTVSGIGSDLMQASDGMRKAMTQDDD